ncbi:F-box/FBD/LRR-repeat protein At1g13570-like [Tasmannia lanceolata]|uniref:F-box/FBD/LRR-repeat protein At1g13570-like n=1 Tax=Tasmannia lanceolata TaxID=3420 RepID=UPI004063481B
MNSCSKRERGLVSNLDLISNLPEDAIDRILVHLPIKDAVRTSILSRNWRYKWVTIPQIVFDVRCRSRHASSMDIELLNITCVKIVYYVLFNHRGPIRKFKCSRYLPSSSDFDQWLLFLSKQGIEEIILEFFGRDYKLPSSLFSCQEMHHLRLRRCIFNIPPPFEGFHCLKILYLHKVTFLDDMLEFLVSNSPLLECLTFIDIRNPSRLKINAPNLQYVYIKCQFTVFSFENTPVLAYAYMYFIPTNYFGIPLVPGVTCNFIELLSCLLNIKKLAVGSAFLKVLASCDVPESIPITFDHLKKLSLEIDLEDPYQILAAFCLFRSSPNLKELKIQTPTGVSSTAPVTNYREAKKRMDYSFNHLLTVKMSKMRGVISELEFIELLLVNAPLLKTLTISKSLFSPNEEARIFKELLELPRASSKARITFKD